MESPIFAERIPATWVAAYETLNHPRETALDEAVNRVRNVNGDEHLSRIFRTGFNSSCRVCNDYLHLIRAEFRKIMASA
jgi:hypothetical protein